MISLHLPLFPMLSHDLQLTSFHPHWQCDCKKCLKKLSPQEWVEIVDILKVCVMHPDAP